MINITIQKTIKLLIILITLLPLTLSAKIIVAIDAGHGGKDPGALGASRFYEKNITLAIAKKIQKLAKNNRDITIVLTREDDTYLTVYERSEVARKLKADYLISIHADVARKKDARGSAVWVLSTRRADTELGRWLEAHEKYSDLLGGAGDVLANDDENEYLNQTVLDLQFAYSQRAGYELGESLINGLSKRTPIHKEIPLHASLGVLRSPDIPSALVEVGFLSNPQEERLLKTDAYQTKIAQGILDGLINYSKEHPKKR